jgi:hypothetical protein
MLSFTWNAPPNFPEERPQRTFVVLFFTPVDGGVRLELNHLGWPASGLDQGGGRWSELYDYFSKAWPQIFDALSAAFPSVDS